MTLKKFFTTEYEKNPENAVSLLNDDTFIKRRKWKRVFKEGVGDGIYSPDENIVAIFDEDDLDEYAEYFLEEYDDNWVDY